MNRRKFITLSAATCCRGNKIVYNIIREIIYPIGNLMFSCEALQNIAIPGIKKPHSELDGRS